MKNNRYFLIYAALLMAVSIWGLSFVVTKIALKEFSVYGLILARFGSASVIFLIILTLKGFPKFTKTEHGSLILIAIFQPGLYFFFETMGLQNTTASKAGLIVAMIPIVVLLLSAIFFREKITSRSVTGIGLSLVGVGLLIIGEANGSWPMGGNIIGDLYMCGAVLSAAIYMIMVKKLSQKHSVLHITGMQIIYGTLIFIPFCLIKIETWQLSQLSFGAIAAVFFLAVLATIVAFFCYNFALSQIDSSKAVVFINMIPVITAASAWIIIGESLTIMQMGGGALVLLAVWLVNQKKRQAVNELPPTIIKAS
ncbi:MAG: DMT family transporter [Deltaproteobacteria bacterium]|nr:DMT family transporter [Deltaproteobacteria bacterium]